MISATHLLLVIQNTSTIKLYINVWTKTGVHGGVGNWVQQLNFLRFFSMFVFRFFFFSVKSPLLGLGNCSNLIKYPPLCSTKPLSRPFLLLPQEKPLKYKKANHFLTSFAMLALFPSFFSETFKGHGVFITFFDRSINQLNMTSHQ